MKSWNITVDGVPHKIECKKNKVIVDGNETKLKSMNPLILLVDHEIRFGNTLCNLVVVNKSCKLAVNGVYVDTQEPYTPVENIPVYTYILAAVSCILGFLTIGLPGLCLGVIFTLFYALLAANRKIIPLIITFIIATALEILFALILIQTL